MHRIKIESNISFAYGLQPETEYTQDRTGYMTRNYNDRRDDLTMRPLHPLGTIGLPAYEDLALCHCHMKPFTQRSSSQTHQIRWTHQVSFTSHD